MDFHELLHIAPAVGSASGLSGAN